MRRIAFALLLAAPAYAQTELQELTAPVPLPEQAFGWSVAAAGGWLAVGAPDPSGSGLGKVHVYREDHGLWVHEQALYPVVQRRDCYTSRVPASQDLCHEVDTGISLAISGDRILTGAPGAYRGSLPDHVGQAFLFRYIPADARWKQETELGALASPAPLVGDSFGWSVAIDGDIAVVGAPDRSTFTGCAYVFERTTQGWSQTAFLTSDTPGASRYFGMAVTVDGERIAVCEPRDSAFGLNAGAVHVFRRSAAGAWQREAKIFPEPQFRHPPATVYFGSSVDMSAGILVIGAIFYGAQSPAIVQDNPGAAYVYRLEQSGAPQWVFQEELQASDGARENEFGGHVAISGNRIVVSAAQWDLVEALDDNRGSSYVYGWNGSHWIEEAILRPANAHDREFFGTGTACEGDLIVIGADQDDPGGHRRAGSVHVFSMAP